MNEQKQIKGFTQAEIKSLYDDLEGPGGDVTDKFSFLYTTGLITSDKDGMLSEVPREDFQGEGLTEREIDLLLCAVAAGRGDLRGAKHELYWAGK